MILALSPDEVNFIFLLRQPDWQLSRIGEEKEKKIYTTEDGTVQVLTCCHPRHHKKNKN